MVHNILYLYIIICVSMFGFNLIYMFMSLGFKKREYLRKAIWKKILLKEFKHLEKNDKISYTHKILLMILLKRVRLLSSFNYALRELSHTHKSECHEYIFSYRKVFIYLANYFVVKSPLYRGYYAYIMGNVFSINKNEMEDILIIFIKHLDGSTSYCRKNIFTTLSKFGHIGIMEQFIIKLSELGKKYDSKLLSMGLNDFSGDKEELCRRLWSHYRRMNDSILIALIHFSSAINFDCTEVLYKIYETKSCSNDVKYEIDKYLEICFEMCF